MTRISFTSNGYKLAGNLFVPDGKPKTLAFLFMQGWVGHQQIQAAKAVTTLGFITMTYDMRGNGDSQGTIEHISRADFLEDATAAYDYLKAQTGGAAIGIVGMNFGGYIAVLLTQVRRVYCLSLCQPSGYPDDGYDKPQLPQHNAGFVEWRKRQLRYSQNYALTSLHHFNGPIQIIEAGADEQTPSQTPKNYAEAIRDTSRLTYEVMPNAPHNLSNDELQADYAERLLRWVNRVYGL